MAASQSEVLSRELVQRTLHQLHEYNAEGNAHYLNPLMALSDFEKNRKQYLTGLSQEEVADLEDASARI